MHKDLRTHLPPYPLRDTWVLHCVYPYTAYFLKKDLEEKYKNMQLQKKKMSILYTIIQNIFQVGKVKKLISQTANDT